MAVFHIAGLNKGSIRGKRYRATLDADYLEKVILG